jgi:hypothetical protein
MSTRKISFSLIEDSALAECVSKYPCIYDLKHTAYKDQQVRENVWKEISNEFDKRGHYKSGKCLFYYFSLLYTY